MAGYHIYGRPFAGSLIAEFLLTEVGEDYTISFPDKEERQSATFRAFSPLGKIRALTTPDGYTICETLAIIEECDESEKFIPKLYEHDRSVDH